MRSRTYAAMICVMVGLGMPTAARAAEPLDSVQGVIQSQLAAFMKDDVAAAYSFTSPGIQQKFPNPTDFFDMVKKGYGPLYRPMHFSFGRSRILEGHIFQELIVTTSDGKDWTAFYHMIRLPDGSYRVNAIRLFHAAPGHEI